MNSKILAGVSAAGIGLALCVAAVQPSLASTGHASHSHSANPAQSLKFKMVRSAGAVANDCLKGAGATVTVKPLGQVEKMTIKAHDLVPNSEYDVFVIQVPDAPFGVSWYQGDLESDQWGNAEGTYEGRFNVETFAVAPGVAQAPVVFQGDGSQNVASPPIHEYHVGIWFGSPDTAVKAGCPNTVTPFNGEHNAGIQALSTTNFDDLNGPLRELD